MNKKCLLVIIALAVVSVWYAVSRERALAGQYEMTTVIVARTDLPAGIVVDEDLVETMQVPRRYMQQDAYEVRDMTDIKLVTNVVTAVPIPKGNQILKSCLVYPGIPKPGEGLPPALSYYLEGIKYFQNSNYEQARKAWKAAKKLDPANTEVAAGLKRIEQILAAPEKK